MKQRLLRTGSACALGPLRVWRVVARGKANLAEAGRAAHIQTVTVAAAERWVTAAVSEIDDVGGSVGRKSGQPLGDLARAVSQGLGGGAR